MASADLARPRVAPARFLEKGKATGAELARSLSVDGRVVVAIASSTAFDAVARIASGVR